MRQIGSAAVAAQGVLAVAPGEQRDRALRAMAAALRARQSAILEANALDMADAEAAGLTRAGLDRLRLDAARVEAMARGAEDIAALADRSVR